MRTVQRYKLTGTSARMPAGARILGAETKVKDIEIYAEVDTTAPMVDRRFILVNHGAQMDPWPAGIYVATVKPAGASDVQHLYDRGERS